MGHTAGQRSNRLHFFSLQQLGFKFFLLGHGAFALFNFSFQVII